METNANLTPDAQLPVVVLGRDEAGRPHASRFEPDEAALATKAAGLMGFKVLPISDDVAPLAAKLPKGKVFASGDGDLHRTREMRGPRHAARAGPIGAAASNVIETEARQGGG